MAEGDSVRFWEFEVKVNGDSAFLVSNSALLNVFCAAFVRHPLQVVTKITTETVKPTKICVLTKGEEAREQLLCDFSYKTIYDELTVIGQMFSDVSISSITLVQAGFILNASEKEFQDVENDMKTALKTMDTFSRRSQLILSNSSIANDSDRVISEQLSASGVNELLKSCNAFVPEEDVTKPQKLAHCSSSSSALLPGQSSSLSNSAEGVLTDFERLQIANLASSSSGSCNEVNHADQVEQIELRPYQVELAQPGLEGKNCIILAPTGSGKTVVAAHICKEYIAKHSSPRILFLVPRVPLVQQQYGVFSRYIGKSAVNQISKGSAVPASELIRRHTLSVMTAQILYNELNDGGIELKEIDLLIFDECHHAMKKHVYKQIMSLYMDKFFISDQADHELPQIIGLSASLKVKTAKLEEKVKEAILTLMANLNVTIPPVQVVEHKRSLQIVQNKAKDETVMVRRPADDVFANKIKKAMAEIERLIKVYHEKYYNVFVGLEMARTEDKEDFDPQGRHGGQEYEEWVVSLLKESKKIRDADASLWFMRIAHNLRAYNDALIMNDHVRSSDVKDFLELFFHNLASNEPNNKLTEIYKKYDPRPTVGTNPLLEQLRIVLFSQYQNKPDSRCIVFVRTREIANALLKYLSEQNELEAFSLNSKLLTGTNAKRENHGMTKTEQEDALTAFKVGLCKVLVSTSVAEEGLDIKQCNLIVTYNYSTNEVGKVQRKGRGRAEDSRFVILAYDDSGHIQKEEINEAKIETTNRVLKKISEADPHQLKLEISEIQTAAKNERNAILRARDLQCRNEDGLIMVYKILCVGCKRQITTSEHIQRINEQHHVVVDPQFNDRVFVKPFIPPRTVATDVMITGAMHCSHEHCREKWGSCMNHKNLPVYVMKVQGIILEDPNGERIVKKKWNEIPFYACIPRLDPARLIEVNDGMLEDEDYEFELDF